MGGVAAPPGRRCRLRSASVSGCFPTRSDAAAAHGLAGAASEQVGAHTADHGRQGGRLQQDPPAEAATEPAGHHQMWLQLGRAAVHGLPQTEGVSTATQTPGVALLSIHGGFVCLFLLNSVSSSITAQSG